MRADKFQYAEDRIFNGVYHGSTAFLIKISTYASYAFPLNGALKKQRSAHSHLTLQAKAGCGIGSGHAERNFLSVGISPLGLTREGRREALFRLWAFAGWLIEGYKNG